MFYRVGRRGLGTAAPDLLREGRVTQVLRSVPQPRLSNQEQTLGAREKWVLTGTHDMIFETSMHFIS